LLKKLAQLLGVGCVRNAPPNLSLYKIN